MLEQDVERMLKRQAARGAEWTPHSELLARYSDDVGLLHWWWRGKPGIAQRPSRLDAIVAEGRQFGVEELTKEAVSAESVEVAGQICCLAAHIAHADGVTRVREGDAWVFYALFDAIDPRASRISSMTLPPPTGRSSSIPPGPLRRTAQTIPDIDRTTASQAKQELARDLLVPVMQEAAKSLPQGFRQALVITTVDVKEGKARFFVHVVASDASGDLVEIDASQALFDAVGAMIAEHRRRGGAAWRKLIAHLRATERGASIDVRVA